MQILDLNNNPLTSVSVSLNANAVNVFSLKIECRTNYVLKATVVADLIVEARLLGSATWINIETAPIDLSAYNSTLQTFEFRLIADNVAVITERDFILSVELQ